MEDLIKIPEHELLQIIERYKDEISSDSYSCPEGDCVICMLPLEGHERTTKTPCCGNTIGYSCVHKFAAERRRSFLKVHQNLDEFCFFCVFCRDKIPFDIDESAYSSLMDTLTTGSIGMGTDVSFGTFISSDVSSDLANLKRCNQCNCSITTHEDPTVACQFCERVIHESCFTELEYKIKTNNLQRGRGHFCTSCYIQRLELGDNLISYREYNFDTDDLLKFSPLSVSASEHFFVSVLMLKVFGYNFRKNNPFKFETFLELFPEMEDYVRLISTVISGSEEITEFRRFVRNIGETKNIFIPYDICNEIISRVPGITEQLTLTMKMVYKKGLDLYPSLAVILRKNHDVIHEIFPIPHRCLIGTTQNSCDPLFDSTLVTDNTDGTDNTTMVVSNQEDNQVNMGPLHLTGFNSPISRIDSLNAASPRRSPRTILRMLTHNMDSASVDWDTVYNSFILAGAVEPTKMIRRE